MNHSVSQPPMRAQAEAMSEIVGQLEGCFLPDWLGLLEKIVAGSSNMVVVTDRAGRITWVNAAYTQVSGWTLAECRGKRPGDFLHGPQTCALARARLSGLLQQGRSVSNLELVNYTKSGRPYHVSLNIEPLRDSAGAVQAYLSIQSDVSERRQTELQMAELKQRLEVAQRLAGLGRIEPHVQSGQPRWSSEIYRMLGLPRDAVPRSVADLLALAHPDELAGLQRQLQAALQTGDEIDLEFAVVGVPGACRWLRCRGLPHAEGGGWTAPQSWSVQDITLYKSQLDAKRQRNEELNQMVQERTREMAESYQALEEFSYALSHDLRAPLRHVASYAELLKEDLALGETQAGIQHCEKIVQAALKMRRIIDGMLAFARLGRAGLNLCAIDSGELIRDVVAGLMADAGRSEIVWRIKPGLPVIQGDPVLLREVWVNVLGNALKYSRHRLVSEIDVDWQPHPDGWVFFVRDNGVGFDPGQADKLFGMFQRLHRDPQFEGAGIGLALARRILEGHGGRIWATSKPEQGATFYIFMPEQVKQTPMPTGLLAGAATEKGLS